MDLSIPVELDDAIALCLAGIKQPRCIRMPPLHSFAVLRCLHDFGVEGPHKSPQGILKFLKLNQSNSQRNNYFVPGKTDTSLSAQKHIETPFVILDAIYFYGMYLKIR